MERRTEPRFKTERGIHLTVLGENAFSTPVVTVEVSGRGMRVLLNRPVPVGAAIKLEPGNEIILGEVCYCQPDGLGFAVGLRLDQVLSNLEQLEDLNRNLLSEERQPEHVPVKALDLYS